jgi:hypothetical protein
VNLHACGGAQGDGAGLAAHARGRRGDAAEGYGHAQGVALVGGDAARRGRDGGGLRRLVADEAQDVVEALLRYLGGEELAVDLFDDAAGFSSTDERSGCRTVRG